jgi:hypothetical protein
VGYDVHITRKEHWSDEAGPEISLDEWLHYVGSDPEMRLDGFAEAALPGGSVLRTESPGIAVWTTYSGHEVDGNMAWFCHFGDRVTVKNPDEEILQKMARIAQTLAAKVQGDDGEEYDLQGYTRGVAMVDLPELPSDGRRWWKFW